jgi:hypothetical protein
MQIPMILDMVPMKTQKQRDIQGNALRALFGDVPHRLENDDNLLEYPTALAVGDHEMSHISSLFGLPEIESGDFLSPFSISGSS